MTLSMEMKKEGITISLSLWKNWPNYLNKRAKQQEEMADVALGLVYLQEICGVSTLDLYKAMNVKIDRLERILDEKGVYL